MASNSLSNFTFDDGEDWFGINDKKTDTTTVESVVSKVKASTEVEDDDDEDETPAKIGDKKKAATGETEVEDETEVEPDFSFEAKEDPKKETTVKKEATKTTTKVETADVADEEDNTDTGEDIGTGDKEIFTTLATDFKERGIFQHVEIEDGVELDEEKFFELHDAEIEARVEETIESIFESVDEDGKAYIKHLKAGGTTASFAQTYFAVPIELKEEFDADDEKEVDRLLKYYLSSVEELEGEDLEDRITWLKEGGKDKAQAAKYHKKLYTAQEENKAAFKAADEKREKDAQINAKAFATELKGVINKTDKVGAFTISKDDQKNLEKYLIDPKVKVGKNKFVPQFQTDLHKILSAGTDKDKQKLVLLAKLIQSDFDVSDLVTVAETKVAKQAKSGIARAKIGVKAKSNGGAVKRELAEFFD